MTVEKYVQRPRGAATERQGDQMLQMPRGPREPQSLEERRQSSSDLPRLRTVAVTGANKRVLVVGAHKDRDLAALLVACQCGLAKDMGIQVMLTVLSRVVGRAN